MGKSLTRKIIESHYVSGSMIPGEEVFLHIDQTLTHDINAVMTYLAFEAIGLDRVQSAASATWITTCSMWITRRRTITSTCSQRPAVTAYMYQDRATGSVMRFMWRASVLPVRSVWAATAIHRTAERSACSVSVWEVWM